MGTDLSDLESYQMAESLAQVVWGVVERWKPFERQTIGSQLVRAADSVGANIAESHGDSILARNSSFFTTHVAACTRRAIGCG